MDTCSVLTELQGLPTFYCELWENERLQIILSMCLPRPDVWSCISAAGPTRQRRALPDFVPHHHGCLYWLHFALHQSIWTRRMSLTFMPQILKTQWRGGTVCLSVNHQNASLSSFLFCLTLPVFLYFRSALCRQLSLHMLSSVSFSFLLFAPQHSQSLLHL